MCNFVNEQFVLKIYTIHIILIFEYNKSNTQ